MSSFKEYLLKDCIELIIDHRGKTPAKMGGDWVDNGYRVISALNVHNGSIDNVEQIRCVTEEVYKRWMSEDVKRNDCFISSEGASLGENCIWDSDEKIVLGQRLYAIRTNSDILDPWYFACYMQTNKFRRQIDQISTGSTVFGISQPVLLNIKLMLPELRQQKLIGDLYKKLKRKIEDNNKINDTLEAMARTVFNYWFLQFDFPDENGKPYKSSGGQMVWSEELKKEIPKGWKIKKIKECIKHINTGLNPRDNFVLGYGDFKYVTVKNLMPDGTLDFSSCATIDRVAKEIVHKRSNVEKGDILFASIAPLGRCFIVQEAPEMWDINESVFSIRPDVNIVSTEYLYLFFTSQSFIKLAEHSSTGSIFSGIRISTLEDMLIIVPNEVTMQKFTDYISDILCKKYVNFIENQEMASLRDFLLPLLMNGQVGFREC